MKENIYTDALNKANKIMGDVSNKAVKIFAGTAPFDSEPKDMKRMEDIYDRLSNDPNKMQKMLYLIQTYGEENINNKIYEMEMRKKRRGGI